jgi:hypothetical protein
MDDAHCHFGVMPARPMNAYALSQASREFTAMNAIAIADVASHFVLRFESLFDPGRGLAFPCDEHGRVALDALSERARRNYFYARVVVGHEFATPAVIRTDN